MDWDIVNNWILDNLLGICAIAIPVMVTIGIFLYQRTINRKRLSYLVLTKSNLVNRHIKENKIKFLYDGNELDDITLVEIKIINDGYTPIPKEDFDKSLLILFGSESKILSHEIIENYPDNLEVNCTSNGDILEIQPMLLNKNEHFTIKLLLSGKLNANIKPSSRIKGITEITKAKIPLGKGGRIFLAINGIIISFMLFITLDSESAFLAKVIMCGLLIGFLIFTYRGVVRPKY